MCPSRTFMKSNIYFLIFILTFGVLKNFGIASPPDDWIVSTKSTLMTTDPNRIKTSQYTDTTNYYLGDGKIYRTVFILPGHVPSDPEIVQLDSKRTQELEIAISNVAGNYQEIVANLPAPPEGSTTYSKVNFSFRLPQLMGVDLVLNASGSKDQSSGSGKLILRDLYTIEDILGTSVGN